MRLTLAIAVAASMTAYPVFAQTAPPAPEPMSPATAKSEDALSGNPPPKDERGGKEKQVQGHEAGWAGHGKTPEETKAEAKRNEAEGQGLKQPEEGK
jgi:hypothetical protein